MDSRYIFMLENHFQPDYMNCFHKTPMENYSTCTDQQRQQSTVTVNCLKVQTFTLEKSFSTYMKWLWISIQTHCLQMSLGNCTLQGKVFQENT